MSIRTRCGRAPVDDQDVRRAARLLAVGALLLVLRLPWLGVVGWVAGSVLVMVGAVLVRRAVGRTGPSLALDVAVAAAFCSPVLEVLAVDDLAVWAGGAGLVRVGGALVVSWTVARRLDEVGPRHAGRRWSAVFASQLAVWVPLAIHVAAAAARNGPASVDGAAAVGVFALSVVPLGLLFWSAAVTEDKQPAPMVVAG